MSCWTRECGRGHTYEGYAHYDYCPECYKEIPQWAIDIMNNINAAKTMPAIRVTTGIDSANGFPRIGKTTESPNH